MNASLKLFKAHFIGYQLWKETGLTNQNQAFMAFGFMR